MAAPSWLKWISTMAAPRSNRRARRRDWKESTGKPEPLETRALLSQSSLVPEPLADSTAPSDSNSTTTESTSDSTTSDTSTSQDGTASDLPSGSSSETGTGNNTTTVPDEENAESTNGDRPIDDGATSDDGSLPDPRLLRTDQPDEGSDDTDESGDESSDVTPIFYSFNSANTAGTPAPDYSYSLTENATNGTILGTLISSDPDSSATVTFQVTDRNDSGAFWLNAQTGELVVHDGTLLDFETLPTIELTVQITDQTHPEYSQSVTVRIDLSNVNEAPVLDDVEFSIPESSANNTVVGELFASDPDVGSAFQYQITSGNQAGLFSINSYTGRITVANGALLNYETKPVYQLTVQVTDSGSPELSTTAQVTINLSNTDDPPGITMSASKIRYTQGGSAVRFGTKSTIFDEDTPNPNFNGMLLNVSIVDNRSVKDVLAVKDTGEKSKKIVVHGNNIVYGRTIIGTLEGGKGSAPTLSITFNSAASQAAVQALLRALSFSTTDSSTNPRTIKLQLVSADGHILNSTTKGVAIKKVEKSKFPGFGFF